MKITLYNSKEKSKSRGLSMHRTVVASINTQGQLIIHCFDINNTANSMWGDAGVEFSLTVDEENKKQLALQLEVNNKEHLDKELLKRIYTKFGELDSCFENIMDYFKTRAITYKYNRW